MKINSLYLAVFDMDRAVTFYEKNIFKKTVKSKTDRFSVFEINGFLFCLFNPKSANEAHKIGNNCIPTIELDNVETFYREISEKHIKVVLELHNVNGYQLFLLEDSEQNIIEFYQTNANNA